MLQGNLTIGTLASQTNMNVPTIRYYEEIGLLPPAQRAANGHRFYGDGDLKRLSFIKRCRDFGFPIEQVRTLVALFEDGDRSCIEVRDMAQIHLNEVRAKQEEMRLLEASLAAFVASCDEACCKGPTRDCAIIEDLSAADPKLPPSSSNECCDASPIAEKPKELAKSTTFFEIRRT
ncbi:MerR family transcriptional regulator [Noviherbaspirillum sp. Root189]|uniref:MerR family transcriptional regulator n=1 Tax=Noviherbaspirillum sp. Root189 TaxID=1736487 RepID=UPI0009E9085C|nr:helix-turn-helix domain-containing protein [Noviherbaspirillum sp. Root189]